MRIHSIEHVDFEGPAAIGLWAAERGHSLARTRIFAGEPMPQPAEYDLLVLMGGPMSVHDELEFPWLAEEKGLVRRAVAAGRGVFGVCLGAQMLSEVLGGSVSPNPRKEIGWHTVRLTPWALGNPAFAGLPGQFTAFHWHGETFSIPRGASCLAESDACATQAFALGARLVGLQFHVETTAESMEALLTGAAEDITPGPSVQTAEQMRAGAGNLAGLRPLMDKILDNMAREV